MEATYRAAKAAGVLPLMWLLMVVVAPVTEELFFRGFLHRGWAPSWLGVSGTIVVTAVLWALLHQQYNVLGILFIFVMGLIFGWLRQRSGSTLLPMALHTVNNLWATALRRHPGRVAELTRSVERRLTRRSTRPPCCATISAKHNKGGRRDGPSDAMS